MKTKVSNIDKVNTPEKDVNVITRQANIGDLLNIVDCLGLVHKKRGMKARHMLALTKEISNGGLEVCVTDKGEMLMVRHQCGGRLLGRVTACEKTPVSLLAMVSPRGLVPNALVLNRVSMHERA